MTPVIWTLIAVFLVADLVFLPPYIARIRRLEMDATARAAAPGQFADLSLGKTYYQWHGPKSGDIIVLIHGLTTPSYVFAGIIPDLTEAGYRVLTYDLYGRGWSDRPRNRQSGQFFAHQLDELLDDQMISKPLNLLGYSMGGAIATAYSIRHPDRIKSLILLASAGFSHSTGGLVRFIRNTPILGDWIMSVFGGANLRKTALADDASDSAIPDLTHRLVQETRYRGYSRSVLSSLRNVLSENFATLHRKLSAHHIPTLALWGSDDETIPLDSADHLQSANPNVSTIILKGGTHSLAHSRPELTTREVLNWLNTNEKA